ncbi:pyridoxal phosphate-dependent aminotransferase [Fulvivirga sedimenti]|uniref:Histidinol-phosphate aminotransferase family protein n=1 Tax=Fulvivirga sedimenti TaxID=2879465 RepID=A0A9X1KYD8_9BACT|nr:histidinol-phosphate transaminase [Fulvivirga sedimenti]MCA6073501.1 histidinol-phosphate aminotransferase family protein [Fulvivirga sedimenti]
MKTSINRRQLLRSGLLTAGSVAFMPLFSHSEIPPVRALKRGRLDYSPLYKEFVLPANRSVAEVRARLNSNENKFGPSPNALKALSSQMEHGNLYGWQAIQSLKEELAAHEGVSSDHILIGPGSTDFLEKCGMAFFMNGGNLVSADPTFMTLIRVAEAVGAEWKNIPLRRDWSHDLSAMEKAVDANTKMVYVCNPNNPTGTLTDADDLLAFCERTSSKVPVFVDEAYMEFLEPGTGKTTVSLVKKGNNVIVARTFSKIHGMAGLRIGYIVGQPETLEIIARLSFTGMGISNTSIAAARASLKDVEYVERCRSIHNEIRDFTFSGLKSLGYDPVRSYTSFMIFPIRSGGSAFLKNMENEGVQIRTLQIAGSPYCRVSLGTKDEMQIFLDAVKKVES